MSFFKDLKTPPSSDAASSNLEQKFSLFQDPFVELKNTC
jgi:hypothetical protein